MFNFGAPCASPFFGLKRGSGRFNAESVHLSHDAAGAMRAVMESTWPCEKGGLRTNPNYGPVKID